VKVAVTTAVVRAALKWLLRFGLDRGQEIAFWLLVPTLILGTLWMSGRPGTSPDLRMRIERISITPPPELPPPQAPATPGTYLLVTASVRNLGTPSIADDWSLLAEIEDTKVAASGIMVGDKLTFRYGERVYTYPSSEMLYNKSLDPIPTGGRAVGLLLFVLENVNPTNIRAGTAFTLTCHDVLDSKLSTRFVWPAVTTGFFPVPGLEK
jgi:hypothetical protein